jgi:hypothetical protein
MPCQIPATAGVLEVGGTLRDAQLLDHVPIDSSRGTFRHAKLKARPDQGFPTGSTSTAHGA